MITDAASDRPFESDLVLEGQDLAALRGDRLIFNHLDFRVQTGEALTLTGRNGAGKSTLMRMIAGFVPPFAGQVLWRGTPTRRQREEFAAEFVYAGHKDGLKTALTAEENLTMTARLTGVSAVEPRAALDQFGIVDLADLPVGYMSAGQRRRVALGRLVMSDTPLWLLDEPLTAIDAATIDVLGSVMRTHLDQGGLIVAATHAPLPGITPRVLEITAPQLDDADYDDEAVV